MWHFANVNACYLKICALILIEIVLLEYEFVIHTRTEKLEDSSDRGTPQSILLFLLIHFPFLLKTCNRCDSCSNG